jgi:hypothetical protein
MTIIAEESLIVNRIGETIKGSLGLLSQNILEHSYDLDVSGGLAIQIVSDWTTLMRDIDNEYTRQEFSPDLKRSLTTIPAIVIRFFERYSEFGDPSLQSEINKFKTLCDALIDLIEGLEEINTSEKNNTASDFLEQLYNGIDLVTNVIETKSAELPINLLSVMKVIFIQLPVAVQTVLDNFSSVEQSNQKAIKKYLREINRSIASGLSSINTADSIRWRQVKSEEERLNAQAERNFVPMQLIEFWLLEDQQRFLTKEDEAETQMLMNSIDDHRDRQLFK